MSGVEDIAAGLTKASKRALVKMSADAWVEEGPPGPSREDAYSLWWGRDGKKGLVLSPTAFAFTTDSCRWKWCLTPLGFAVRAHLKGEG